MIIFVNNGRRGKRNCAACLGEVVYTRAERLLVAAKVRLQHGTVLSGRPTSTPLCARVFGKVQKKKGGGVILMIPPSIYLIAEIIYRVWVMVNGYEASLKALTVTLNGNRS